MKTRPILFSAPMVQAILEGRKTQTRRIVKPPKGWGDRYPHCDPASMPPAVWWWDGDHSRVGVRQVCPYGQPGDRLWVRETWQYADWTDDGYPCVRYAADGVTILHDRIPDDWFDRLNDIWAGLSSQENYSIDNRAADRRWRSSRFMPRWASRITLEITAVRVERLGELSESNAIQEGVTSVAEFIDLWKSINNSWEPETWVWVIQFRKL